VGLIALSILSLMAWASSAYHEGDLVYWSFGGHGFGLFIAAFSEMEKVYNMV
jgi:hypothetical protein